MGSIKNILLWGLALVGAYAAYLHFTKKINLF